MPDIAAHTRTDERRARVRFDPLSQSKARRVCVHVGLTAGGPPDAASVQRLAWEGFAAIIDLRAAESATLAGLAEAARAAQTGLGYIAAPFSRFDASPAEIDRVLEIIAAAPAPAYLHCEDGQAALMLALMAGGEMASAGQMQARMAAWGAPLFDVSLQDAARAWFAARGLYDARAAARLRLD